MLDFYNAETISGLRQRVNILGVIASFLSRARFNKTIHYLDFGGSLGGGGGGRGTFFQFINRHLGILKLDWI